MEVAVAEEAVVVGSVVAVAAVTVPAALYDSEMIGSCTFDLGWGSRDG